MTGEPSGFVGGGGRLFDLLFSLGNGSAKGENPESEVLAVHVQILLHFPLQASESE